jgi:hypothetical protein
MRSLYFFALGVILFSCGSKREIKEKPKLPMWLQGEWISTQDSIDFVESWKALSDSVFEGHGNAYKGDTVLFSEELQIRRKGDTIYYIPTVADQNQGQPVWFRFTKTDSASFLAENPAHDFPKTILYELKGKDSLIATLKGVEDGQERTEVFRMKKR